MSALYFYCFLASFLFVLAICPLIGFVSIKSACKYIIYKPDYSECMVEGLALALKGVVIFIAFAALFLFFAFVYLRGASHGHSYF